MRRCWGFSFLSFSPFTGRRWRAIIALTRYGEPDEGQALAQGSCPSPALVRYRFTRAPSPRRAGRGKESEPLLFKFQTAMTYRPCSLSRPGKGLSSLFIPPPRNTRGWRAKRRVVIPMVAPSLAKVRRLLARHRGVLRQTGRASGGYWPPKAAEPRPFWAPSLFCPGKANGFAPSASSWRQVLMPASGAPSPPERVRCVSPRPRAPHPAPQS